MREIEYFSRNKKLLADGEGYRPIAEENKINLNWWHIKYYQKVQNLGDMLSPVIFEYMCSLYGLKKEKSVSHTKHLYIVGSILFFENQDAVVWGAGALNSLDKNINNIVHQKYMRKLDIRAVRGPCTHEALKKIGIKCPQIYGDPAVLMPLIYKPNQSSSNKALILTHLNDNKSARMTDSSDIVISNMRTDNWKSMIDLIASARVVISSSLHGIILAESYGVPAILLRSCTGSSIFKYKDYYWGTGRKNIIAVNTIEEGLRIDPFKIELPEIEMIQKRLIGAFPIDIWY